MINNTNENNVFLFQEQISAFYMYLHHLIFARHILMKKQALMLNYLAKFTLIVGDKPWNSRLFMLNVEAVYNSMSF